ncbi:hypothetical protein D3C75_512020 [compost metagenome]
MAERVHFGFNGEAAAVDQREAIYFSLVLVRSRLSQRSERIMLVAAHTTAGLQRCRALLQPSAGEISLPRPAAGQIDQVKLSIFREIDRSAECTQQIHRSLAVIDQLHRAGNDIRVPVYGIPQNYIQRCIIIAQRNLQRIRFFR